MAEKKVTDSEDKVIKTAPVEKTTKKTETKAKSATAKKADDVVETVAEKVEEKVGETVAEVKKAAKTVKKAAKETAKKAVEKKAAEKATATKKTTAKTTSSKSKLAKVYVQYNNNEASQEELIQRIIEKWVAESGKKESSIKTFDIYVKPEDNAAYYVINGQGSSIELF